MQTVLDSFCRCFGTPESMPRPDGHHSDNNNPEDSIVESSASRSDVVKRRTDRLELQDKQWDELFEKANGTPRSSLAGADAPTASTVPMDNTERCRENNNNEDLEYAQALAKVKLAANPSRHRSSHKRKRPSRSRDEIFRHRRYDDSHASSHNQHNPHYPKPSSKATAATSSFTRFLSGQSVMANALCFATPIRDTDDEPVVTIVESNDNSDANTLNTCEDTITSTLYFDSKYAHVVQSQPPMPLFNQFKVDERHDDELRRIVANDSHNSLKMIRLMQSSSPKSSSNGSNNNNRAHVMKLMEDSSESEGETPEASPERRPTLTTTTTTNGGNRSSSSSSRPVNAHTKTMSTTTTKMDLDDPPPVAKAITNSSRSSSGSRSNTAPLTPASSGQPYPSERTGNERRFLVL